MTFQTAAYAATLLIAALAFFWAFGFVCLYGLLKFDLSSDGLVLSPLVGIGAVLAIAANCIYLDVPFRLTMSILLAVFVILLVICAIRLRKPQILREWVQKTMHIALLLLLPIGFVCIVQGWAYFVLGPARFIGYGTHDMWYYTVIAQFFMDFPFSTPLLDGNRNPILPLAITSIGLGDHVGPPVIQAVLATMFGLTAKEAWGVVSLLGPVLLVCPLWLIGREIGLPPYQAAFSALLGASLPGIAWIHLENTLLAHAMALPSIVLWPFLVHRLLRDPTLPMLSVSTIIFFSIAFIFGEMVLVLIVLSVIMLAWNIVSDRPLKHGILGAFAVLGSLAMGMILLPEYTKALWIGTAVRPFIPRGLWPPDAFTLPAFVRVFSVNLHNFDIHYARLDYAIVLLVVFGVLLGYFGLFLHFISKESPLSIGLLALICLPITLISTPEQHAYIYYKSLTSFATLLPFGIAYIVLWLGGSGRAPTMTLMKGSLLLVATTLLCLAIPGTLFSSLRLIGPGWYTPDRDPKFTALADMLEHTRDRNFLIDTKSDEARTWFAYHGRNNHLWFTGNVYYGGWDFVEQGKYMRYHDLSTMPKSGVDVIRWEPR